MSSFHANQQSALDQSLIKVQGQINVSLELFPPRTSGVEQTLWSSIDRLSSLKPEPVSVTYGANSSERDRTHGIIKGIEGRTDLGAAPYLTCIDVTPTKLQITVRDYWNNGVHHIVALRGDLPPGNGKPEMYASGLVTLLEEVADLGTPVTVCPEVHPEARSAQVDLLNPRRKVGAGVNRAIIRFFFDIESYLRFHSHCISAGTDVKIILGILSVSNPKQTKKFADMTSVHIPAWMAQIFDGLDDNTETRKLASANIAMDIMKVLSREEVKDLHLYTLNRAEMSYVICHTLGVRPGL